MGNQQIRPSYLWGSFAGILFSGKTLSCCVGNEPVQEQVATRGAIEEGRRQEAEGRRRAIERGFQPLPIAFLLKRRGLYRIRGKGEENLLPSALCPLPSKAEALVKSHVSSGGPAVTTTI